MNAPTAERTEEQIGHILDQFADAFSRQARSPVLHSPSELGLNYEDVTFGSRDGVPLEGWLIPAAGSDKLVIARSHLERDLRGPGRRRLPDLRAQPMPGRTIAKES